MVDKDSWEALDVDDSDLPSLIRPSPAPPLLPCKRSSIHQTRQNPITNTKSHSEHTALPSPLSLCSQLSLQSQPKPTNQIIPSPYQSQQPLLLHQIEEGSSAGRRIPGPAGALQASMQRRALANRNGCSSEEEISTQDYLRRVQEIEAEDEDFKLNPWLCALEFLGRNVGVVNSPLKSIKSSSLSTDRLDQVVAIVKSCTPNGFGDLIVTLKDPTGTVGASIHRNVVTGSDFGKDISVGSVLILQKVVVFSPSRSAHNLNITLRNVVKVISKDSGPPAKHSLASMVRGVRSDTEHVETRVGIVEKRASVVSRVSAEDIVNRMVREKIKEKTIVDDDRQMEDCGGVEEEMVDTEDHYAQTMMDKLEDNAEVGAKVRSAGRDNNVEEEMTNNNNVRTIAPIKERQHLISKATLPEWTDEQLDELFAASFDDE